MTESHAERVAVEVRVAMTRARRTQTQLAEYLGTSQASVNRRLTGAVPFDVVELVRIAEWLGVTPASLLEAVAS